MHPAFEQTAHRPWPLPQERWTWRQSWQDLLFAHWPLPAERLRPLVPPALELQTFDGAAWVGVVPFRMEGVMRRPWPDLPWVSAFAELNVRLYVTSQGKPGVWFLSLDATNPLAVWAARRFFHLPYYRARIEMRPRGEGFAYTSVRRGTEAAFAAHYAPTSPAYTATPGSLLHALTERYCLYATAPDGSLWRTDVHHVPWPLQDATADVQHNTMLAPLGLALEGPPTYVHFARRLDVVVWSPVKVG